MVILLLPSLCQAAPEDFLWEFPVNLQEGTRYVLHARTVIGTTTAVLERPFALLPQASCRAIDAQATAETQCATICLEPAEYTLQVYAVTADGRQSPLSNEIDVDLRDTARCTPPPVTLPPPPPRQPPSVSTRPGAKDAALAAAALAVAAAFPGNTIPNLAQLVNRDCVQWTIEGPCFCSPFNPCLTVSYWEPWLLVETVKKPGDTLIPILGNLLTPLIASAIPTLFGGGSGGNAVVAGNIGKQFNETHVYTFPQLLGGPCTSCAPSPDAIPTPVYASEVDPAWRTATASAPMLAALLPIGVWQNLYPRGGTSIHGSEPVGAAICAFRGMDIAFNPVGIPPNIETHVVFRPTGAHSTCIQMASPVQTPCFTSGTPPNLWETGTLSVRGRYIFLFWRRRSCCVPPTQSTCGLTLPAVGGHGANGCILPSTP